MFGLGNQYLHSLRDEKLLQIIRSNMCGCKSNKQNIIILLNVILICSYLTKYELAKHVNCFVEEINTCTHRKMTVTIHLLQYSERVTMLPLYVLVRQKIRSRDLIGVHSYLARKSVPATAQRFQV